MHGYAGEALVPWWGSRQEGWQRLSPPSAVSGSVAADPASTKLPQSHRCRHDRRLSSCPAGSHVADSSLAVLPSHSAWDDSVEMASRCTHDQPGGIFQQPPPCIQGVTQTAGSPLPVSTFDPGRVSFVALDLSAFLLPLIMLSLFWNNKSRFFIRKYRTSQYVQTLDFPYFHLCVCQSTHFNHTVLTEMNASCIWKPTTSAVYSHSNWNWGRGGEALLS